MQSWMHPVSNSADRSIIPYNRLHLRFLAYKGGILLLRWCLPSVVLVNAYITLHIYIRPQQESIPGCQAKGSWLLALWTEVGPWSKWGKAVYQQRQLKVQQVNDRGISGCDKRESTSGFQRARAGLPKINLWCSFLPLEISIQMCTNDGKAPYKWANECAWETYTWVSLSNICDLN